MTTGSDSAHGYEVPDSPEAFFAEYLPRRFALVREQATGRSSIGSVTFRVLDADRRDEWSLRLVDGELEVTRAMEDDVLLQATLPADDFVPLIVDSIRRAEEAGRPTRGTALLRALSLDVGTARGLRHVPGSVLVAVREPSVRRRLLLTPGIRVASLESAECSVEMAVDDFADMQRGTAQPMQLFASGKLRITGNPQIVLALGALFM